MARQTPQQKRANDKFAKVNEKHMGRPESSYKKKDAQKSPVGMPILILLLFVVVVPLLLEFTKIGPSVFALLRSLLAKVGIVSA